MFAVAYSSLPLALLRLVLALLVFTLPGALWANFLTRKTLIAPARVTLGFAISFAVFGLISWPFLWYQREFDELLRWLVPAWCAFAAIGFALNLPRFSAQHLSTLATLAKPKSLPAGGEADERSESVGWKVFGASSWALKSKEPNMPTPPAGFAVDRPASEAVFWVGGYLVAVLVFIYVYGFASSLRMMLLRFVPVLLLAGFWVARRVRPRFAQAGDCSAIDHAAPPRSWIIAALVAVAVQVICVALLNRPDWDDCYYLAAVRDYEQAPVLNAEEPSHREALPVPTQHRTLCWELWGAVLARASGLSPLGLFHTHLPVVLVLLCYGAYTALLRELLPRRYVPLGILALSALHLWGISSHTAAANFLLPRLGQAKSVLLHLAVPLGTTLLLRQAARPSLRIVAALLFTGICALAMSLSALFIMLGLLGGLGLALFLTAENFRRRVAISVAVALSSAPLVAAGLLMRAAMQNEVGLQARPAGSSAWLETLDGFLGRGSAELLWLLTLPLVALLLRDARRRAYLFVYPLILFATLLNPLLFHAVAGSLTSYHTYARLFWLLPIGPALAVGLALACRLFAEARRPNRPLRLALLLLLVSQALPGIYVFGPVNSYIGPLGEPRLLENLDKMPGDLAPIAKSLAALPDVSADRILCNEQIASFLTPYSRDFRFVQTRPLYTPVLFSGAGRKDEGVERALLASVLRRGRLDPQHTRDELLELYLLFGTVGVNDSFGAAIAHASRDLPTLLARYRVRHVITGPGDHADVPALLARHGYAAVQTRGAFTLWQRRP